MQAINIVTWVMVLPLIDSMKSVMLYNVNRTTRGENSAPNHNIISYSEAEENNKNEF